MDAGLFFIDIIFNIPMTIKPIAISWATEISGIGLGVVLLINSIKNLSIPANIINIEKSQPSGVFLFLNYHRTKNINPISTTS